MKVVVFCHRPLRLEKSTVNIFMVSMKMVIIWLMMVNNDLVGGWAYPSEKSWSESQLGLLFPTWWEKSSIHVPNHQIWSPSTPSMLPYIPAPWIRHGMEDIPGLPRWLGPMSCICLLWKKTRPDNDPFTDDFGWLMMKHDEKYHSFVIHNLGHSAFCLSVIHWSKIETRSVLLVIRL